MCFRNDWMNMIFIFRFINLFINSTFLNSYSELSLLSVIIFIYFLALPSHLILHFLSHSIFLVYTFLIIFSLRFSCIFLVHFHPYTFHFIYSIYSPPPYSLTSLSLSRLPFVLSLQFLNCGF